MHFTSSTNIVNLFVTDIYWKGDIMTTVNDILLLLEV